MFIGGSKITLCLPAMAVFVEANLKAMSDALEEVLGEGGVWVAGKIVFPHLPSQWGRDMFQLGKVLGWKLGSPASFQ